MKKIENFLKAVNRLKEAVERYKNNRTDDIARDAMIQRFEFTFELSWKAMKKYMIDQGVRNEMQFPKHVLKSAYENRIIDDRHRC